MNEYLRRKIRRVSFFSRGAVLEKTPLQFCARKYEKIQKTLRQGCIDESILKRVNYYNKLDSRFTCDDYARTYNSLSRSEGSYYYFDLKEYWRLFPSDLKLSYLFGDTVHIPDTPTVVKSRPIGEGNNNSVLLKLDKLRHYTLYGSPDKTPFRQKHSRAVWRGVLNNRLRLQLVNNWGKNSHHDIGYIKAPRLECSIGPSQPLTVKEQLSNRYVISIEGYDVATNLKWIMASQSLCLMPRPKYETWFMEGALVPGVHYVELRPDFEDLDEKISYYDNHIDEAEAIVSAANTYFQQFNNKSNEDLISILVLQKYFEFSGQLPNQYREKFL